MASKKFNGNVPISLKEIEDRLIKEFGYTNPKSELKASTEIFTSNVYDHIYDVDTQLSYKERFGNKAQEQFERDVMDVNKEVAVDENFESMFMGASNDSKISTRENALKRDADKPIIQKFISVIGSICNDLTEVHSKVTREKMGQGNSLDIALSQERSKQEIKAEQRNEQIVNEQIASEQTYYEKNLRDLEKRYEETKLEESRKFEQEQLEFQKRFENEQRLEAERFKAQAKEFEARIAEESGRLESINASSPEYKEVQLQIEEYKVKLEETNREYSSNIEKLDERYKTSQLEASRQYESQISRIEQSRKEEVENYQKIYENRINEAKKYDDPYKNTSQDSYKDPYKDPYKEPHKESYKEPHKETVLENRSGTVYESGSIGVATVASGLNIKEENVYTADNYNYNNNSVGMNQELMGEVASNASKRFYDSPVKEVFSFNQLTQNTGSESQSDGMTHVRTSEQMLQNAGASEGINTTSYDEAQRMLEQTNEASKEAIQKIARDEALKRQAEEHKAYSGESTQHSYESGSTSYDGYSGFSDMSASAKPVDTIELAKSVDGFYKEQGISQIDSLNVSKALDNITYNYGVNDAINKSYESTSQNTGDSLSKIAGSAYESARSNSSSTLSFEGMSQSSQNELNNMIKVARMEASENSQYTQDIQREAIYNHIAQKSGLSRYDDVGNSAAVKERFATLQNVSTTGQSQFTSDYNVDPMAQTAKTFYSSNIDNGTDKLNESQNDVVKSINQLAKGSAIGQTALSYGRSQLKTMGSLFELGSDESYSGTNRLVMTGFPIIQLEAGVVNAVANSVRANKMINAMDFKELNKILGPTTDAMGLNVLTEEMLKNGGINKFSFSASPKDLGMSGVDFKTLNKNLQEAAAKYGGIYANPGKNGVSGIALSKEIKRLEKALKDGIGDAASLKEQLNVAKTLKALNLRENSSIAKAFAAPWKSLKYVGISFLVNLTDDAGRDMAQSVQKGFHAVSLVKDFKRAYKDSRLFNKTRAGKFVKKQVGQVRDKVLGKVGQKATVKTAKTAAQTVTKKTAKTTATRLSRGLANQLTKTKRLANMAGHFRHLTSATQWSAKLAQLLAKVGIHAGHAAATTASTAGAAAGGTALAGATVATGGIALIVVIIVAIIVCCCCCCCSFGAQYNTYESVDAFYTDINGAAVDESKDSMAARTIAFMCDSFEANYTDFIYAGIDNKFEDIPDVPAFTYNSIEYQKGKVQSIEIGEEVEKYEKYIFLKKDESSIYYSDIDNTIDYAIGGKALSVDDEGQYSVLIGITGTREGSQTDINPISNVKEVVAMASVAMANDFGASSEGGTEKTKVVASNFASYCYAEWLSSHYCLYEKDVSFWGWLTSKLSTLFGLSSVSSVEDNYKPEDIYLSCIYCVWEELDPKDMINKITPLNANEYAPENHHYLNTALSFNATGKTNLSALSTNLSTIGMVDGSQYLTISSSTTNSIKSYAAQITINEDGTVKSEGAVNRIADSTFTVDKIEAKYYYTDFVENKSVLDAIVSNAQSSVSPDPCDSESSVLASYNSWVGTISGMTLETALSNGYVKQYEAKGFHFATEAEAKAQAIAYVNEIYTKIEATFGAITNADKGKLLSDVSETSVGIKTECGAVTIPLGEGFGLSSSAVGYTTREDALQMVENAYATASEYQKKIISQRAHTFATTYSNKEYHSTATGTHHHTHILGHCTFACHTEYSYSANSYDTTVTLNITNKETEYSYIMLFAAPSVKTPSRINGARSGETVTAGSITFKNLYKQYFVCGGHTRLVIQPVTLTYVGSQTMFDIDGVIGQLAASGEGDAAVDGYAESLGANVLTAKFVHFSGGELVSTDMATKMWNINTAIGRENVLNATNMVGKNWSQYYSFDWSDIQTSVNSKILDPLSETLYQTDAEADAAGTSEVSIETLTNVMKSVLADADYDGDGNINDQDYDAAKEAGASNAVLDNISSAISRMDRCVLAMDLVGKVGYTQVSHDYVLASPLKKYWSFNGPASTISVTVDGETRTINLGDLYDSGDAFDYGLLYKTDCSGFASYIIGADNELSSTSALAGGVTVTLPKLADTIDDYQSSEFKQLDCIVQSLYDNNAANGNTGYSVTYETHPMAWTTTTAKSLKPGDLVSRTTSGTVSGHVMVYIGPTDSSYTEFYFIHCTSRGSILGPGTVEVKKMTLTQLASGSSGYPNITTVDHDVRNINFVMNR